MKKCHVVSAGALCALAGAASAQVVVNGALDPAETGLYGPIRWVQNVPTGFGDNATDPNCNPSNFGNPGAATTGIEIKIPLAAIGNPAGSIRVCTFLNGQGHDSVSNQILPGLPALSGGVGEPRQTNLSTITGDQYFTVVASAGLDPIADGNKDAEYGAALALQTNRTSFGDATDGLPGTCNGSELDGAYAVIRNGSLFIMLTGNMQTNFNKLEVFIDTDSGTGFNQLSFGQTFPDVDFAALQRMQGNGVDPGDGLTFDAAFSADYYLTFGCGGDPATHYPNFANLVASTGGYLGSVGTGSGSGVLTGGTNPDNIEVAVLNSNIVGVPGLCPPPEGDRDIAGGSEFDGAYGFIDTANGRLNLLITGNIQSNFNKLFLMFDAIATDGQGIVRNDNPDINFNNLNTNLGTSVTQAGLTLDAGFTADYFILYNTNGIDHYADLSTLRDNGRLRCAGNGASLDYGSYYGGNKATFDPLVFAGPRLDIQDGFAGQIYSQYAPRTASAPLATGNCETFPPGDPATGLISISFDNSNILGVTATTADPGAAAAVTTGLELSIALSELGYTGGCIKITGAITDGNLSFMSNQVLGGLPDGTANLADSQLVDFAAIAGNQYIEICPPDPCGSADFDGDGDTGTDADIEAFFACLGGNCCGTCGSADFDGDGDTGTDADIEAFFRVLGGGNC